MHDADWDIISLNLKNLLDFELKSTERDLARKKIYNFKNDSD